jgi:hypothetical protein
MTEPTYELSYLKASLPLLEAYLLSNDLYWPVRSPHPAGSPPFPSLTLSAMLLSEARLSSPLTPHDLRADVERARTELHLLREHWRTAWERKVEREFNARLKLWRDFLEEYRSRPAVHKDRYGYEAGRRVMIELLQAETRSLPAQQMDLLYALDELLRAIFVPGDFIWDDWTKPAFPAQPFWYLYGRLKDRL